MRLGHRALFELALAHIGVSRETRGSVVQLLSTAAGASPLHATARSRRWPAIKAGLEGIGLSAEAIGRCRQLVLQVGVGAGWGEACLVERRGQLAVWPAQRALVPSFRPAEYSCPRLTACPPIHSQAAGEAEAALFRLRTMLAHTVAGRHGKHRAGARPPSAAALACLDELSQLLQYLQVGRPQGAPRLPGWPAYGRERTALRRGVPGLRYAHPARPRRADDPRRLTPLPLPPPCPAPPRRPGACPSPACWWTRCWPRTAKPSPAACSRRTLCRAPPAAPSWWRRAVGARGGRRGAAGRGGFAGVVRCGVPPAWTPPARQPIWLHRHPPTHRLPSSPPAATTRCSRPPGRGSRR